MNKPSKLDFIDELGLTEFVLEEAVRNNIEISWNEGQKIAEKILKDFVDFDCDSRKINEAIYSMFPSRYDS